jgi:tripartite-type tricarboxylate transporter receptor subunit TctC
MLAAGKIPDDLRDRMSRDLLAIVRSPSFVQWCDERLFRPRPSTAPEFARFMAVETELLRKVITTAKITVD